MTSPPRLYYHRLMLPNWLRNDRNVFWRTTSGSNDLQLEIPADTNDWETIFKVGLLPAGVLTRYHDITVKIKVGVILPEPQKHRDPMSYMISDGEKSIGIQLLDPNHDYAKFGPYRAVEGDSGKIALQNPNTEVAATVTTNSKNNPDQFEISIKPSENFGSAYCAIDDGHKIVAQYTKELDLSKGLLLEVYRFKSKEEYKINYVEVTVYEDNPSVSTPYR